MKHKMAKLKLNEKAFDSIRLMKVFYVEYGLTFLNTGN